MLSGIFDSTFAFCNHDFVLRRLVVVFPVHYTASNSKLSSRKIINLSHIYVYGSLFLVLIIYSREMQTNDEPHVLDDSGIKSNEDSDNEPSTWDVDGSSDNIRR